MICVAVPTPVVFPAYWFVHATFAVKRPLWTQSVSLPPLVQPLAFVTRCVSAADVDVANVASPL